MQSSIAALDVGVERRQALGKAARLKSHAQRHRSGMQSTAAAAVAAAPAAAAAREGAQRRLPTSVGGGEGQLQVVQPRLHCRLPQVPQFSLQPGGGSRSAGMASMPRCAGTTAFCCWHHEHLPASALAAAAGIEQTAPRSQTQRGLHCPGSMQYGCRSVPVWRCPQPSAWRRGRRA